MRALLRWHTGLDGRGDDCQGGRVHKRGERRGAGRMRAVLRWHTGLDGRGDCCQRGKGI